MAHILSRNKVIIQIAFSRAKIIIILLFFPQIKIGVVRIIEEDSIDARLPQRNKKRDGLIQRLKGL